MIAYIVMYLAVIYGIINHKKAKAGYFVWTVLLFFSVFRGATVGTDTASYLDYSYFSSRVYGSLELGANTSSYELLTNIVYYIVDKTHVSPRWIIAFFSVVTFVFLLLTAKRARINLVYLMMVFLLGGGYVYSFNISRQWAAMAVAIYAVTYIYETSFKKSLMFFPLIIMASSIHFVSIFYLIIYAFRFIKLKYHIALVFLVVGVLLSMLVIIGDSSSILNFLGDFSNTYSESLATRNLERSFMSIVAAIYYVILYIFILHRLESNNYKHLLPLFACCIVIYSFSTQLDSIIHRFFLLFSFLSSAIIAKYFSFEKNNNYYQLTMFAYLLIATYMFFSGGIVDEYTF